MKFNHINKYQTEQGDYLYNGCHYEDEISLITSGIFGFCGCGRPTDALEYVRDVLLHIQALNRCFESESHTFTQEHDEWKKRGEKLYGSQGASYFTWYVLDNLGLIEHGVGLPGWLTPYGEDLLGDIMVVLKEWEE